MNKEIRLSKKRHLWFHIGWGKRIAFGFSIDKYGIQGDFLCFWFGLEY